MGSVEVAYQYRPGIGNFEADYMVASPANEWGYGWDYDSIFARLKSGGGSSSTDENDVTGGGFESDYDPDTMTAQQLGEVIVEEQYDSTSASIYGTSQTLSLYDLSYAYEVKGAVDDLAVSLDANDEQTAFENIRGYVSVGANGIFYFNDGSEINWISIPFFDLYDLCSTTYNTFSSASKTFANSVMTAIDNMVIYSFAGSDYSGFTEGTNGLFIFFPDGDETYSGYPHWAYQWWYNSLDTATELGSTFLYGKLSWCIDEATAGNSIIDNWFEILDKWFDVTDPVGGYNKYSY